MYIHIYNIYLLIDSSIVKPQGFVAHNHVFDCHDKEISNSQVYLEYLGVITVDGRVMTVVPTD